MDDEKERLEKELRFLKESLEANIISEEEYEKGKKRIEKRLDELGVKVEEKDEELTVDDIKGYGEEQKKEAANHILDEVEKEAEKEEQKDWVAKELKELEEQKLVEPKSETKVAKETKVSAKPKEEKPKVEEKKPEPKEEKPKKTVEQKEEAEADSEEGISPIKIDRKTLRIIGIIAIVILFMLIRRSPTDADQDIMPVEEEEFIPVCSIDEECIIETGKVGICLNPGTKEAACEFYEPVEVELTIINDRTCESCDTSRMLNILRQLFPGLKGSLVDANSPAGSSLINELGVKVLPAYVFDAEINETMKFDKFKRALERRGENYLVIPTASGSNYFFNRLSKPATIELFVEAGQDTTIIDNSMKDVANLFGGGITINRHVVEKADEKSLEREFAITTYPAYVINNQLKFTGTQASEIIKNRFCYLNALPECGTTLSLDIVKIH